MTFHSPGGKLESWFALAGHHMLTGLHFETFMASLDKPSAWPHYGKLMIIQSLLWNFPVFDSDSSPILRCFRGSTQKKNNTQKAQFTLNSSCVHWQKDVRIFVVVWKIALFDNGTPFPEPPIPYPFFMKNNPPKRTKRWQSWVMNRQGYAGHLEVHWNEQALGRAAKGTVPWRVECTLA